MDDVARIEFEERDQQWLVTLTDVEGTSEPGEPFPASGHENYSKLEQVLARLASLGYRPHRIPYEDRDRRWYGFDVTQLEQ